MKTVAELKAEMIASAKKETARKMAEIERKQAIMAAMPDAFIENVHFIHTMPLYGTIGRIDFNAKDLQEAQAIARVYKPTPLLNCHGSGFRSFIPAGHEASHTKRYGGTTEAIAPFVVHLDRYTDSPLQVQIHWFCQLTSDVMVRIVVDVFDGTTPPYPRRGRAPGWARMDVVYSGPMSWGDKRTVERTTASLRLSPSPKLHKFASGSPTTPSHCRFVWADPDLSLSDLVILDQ